MKFFDTYTFESCLKAEVEGYPVSEHTEPAVSVRNIVTSPEGLLIIRTAIRMAPGVPTAVAFEEVLEARIGEAAFSDEMKKYTGYLVRRAVESMGGALLEKGVKVKRSSHYTRGAIYSL